MQTSEATSPQDPSDHAPTHQPPPASSGRMLALDGLRGFAVLIVLFDHTQGVPKGGYLGVDVFFALSGFLISSQLFAEAHRSGTLDLRHFFLKRCCRLLPAFFAMCALYWIVDFCFLKNAPAPNVLRLSSLLIASNIYWAKGTNPYQLLNHTWTLAVEWQFYLLWPFVVMLLAKFGAKKTCVFGLLMFGILTVWFLRFRGDAFIRYDGVLIGSALALVATPDSFWHKVKAHYLVSKVFAVCALLLLLLIFRPKTMPHQLGISVAPLLAGVLILVAVSSGNWLSVALLENRLLAWFGKISYGLYLYHFPIAALMYTNGYSHVQMTLVCVPVSIALAVVSWFYLEEPLLKANSSRSRAVALSPKAAPR